MTRIAIVGLTDHALSLAVSLQLAGAEVVGFDTSPVHYSPVPRAEYLAEALIGAELVLVVASPSQALAQAELIAPLLTSDAQYVDFSASTPEVIRKIALLMPSDAFGDGSILPSGKVELSGPRTQHVAEVLSSYSVEVEFTSDVLGDVATRTLMRSLLAKSVSAALTDTLWAAESLGIQDWAWEEIQKLITIENAQGLIDDTAQNFKRHQIELQDLSELMISSGYESTMVAPIQFNYGRIMHGKKIPSRNQARNK